MRSPSAPRPAAPAPRARTLYRAGQTSTPSCSRRLRRPLRSPPKARRRPPLPYWGRGEKTAAPASAAAALRAEVQTPRGALSSSPRGGARPLARRAAAPPSAAEAAAEQRAAGARITREPIQTSSCSFTRHFRGPSLRSRRGRAARSP